MWNVIRARLFLGAVMALGLGLMPSLAPSLSGLAAQEASVQSGELRREGRAWVQEVRCAVPTRPGGTLRLNASFGSVRVTPGTDREITCRVLKRVYASDEAVAREYLRRYVVRARRLNGDVALAGEFDRPSRRRRINLSVEIQIAVPLRYNLQLETSGGSIAVQTLQGRLKAVTAGGSISTGDIAGVVTVETAGGSITLGNIGNRVQARTAGGSIRVGDVKGDATLETSGGVIVVGLVEGPLHAETAGGDVILRGATGPVTAQTAGGKILIGDSGGSINAQTAGGSIHLRGARGKVVVETAGGSIDLFEVQGAIRAATSAGHILAALAASQKVFVASQLETSMGDIQVYLPADLPLTIEAVVDKAFGHKIVSDFPLQIEGGQARPVRQLHGWGALNGGGEVLRIRAVAGNIIIRKLDPKILEKYKQKYEIYWQRLLEKEERRREREQERLERKRELKKRRLEQQERRKELREQQREQREEQEQRRQQQEQRRQLEQQPELEERRQNLEQEVRECEQEIQERQKALARQLRERNQERGERIRELEQELRELENELDGYRSELERICSDGCEN